MLHRGSYIAVSLAFVYGCALPQRINPAQVTAGPGLPCFHVREPALFHRQVDTCPVFAAKPAATKWRLWLEPSDAALGTLNTRIVDIQKRSCGRRSLLDDVRQVGAANLLIDFIETQRYYWPGSTWHTPFVPHDRTIIHGRASIDGTEQEFKAVQEGAADVVHLMQRYFHVCDASPATDATR